MKTLLIVTAVIEAGAGVALLCCPSATVAILLGSPLDMPAAATLAAWPERAFALGVACWLAHYDAQSSRARGLVGAMLLYNLGAVVILGMAGIRSQQVGVALVAGRYAARSDDRLVHDVSSEEINKVQRKHEMNHE